MSLKSVEEEWAGFSAMIFRGMKPNETQVIETRKAFFAGALAMLTATRQIGEPEVSVDEGVAYMEARWQECQEFYRTLIREYSQKN